MSFGPKTFAPVVAGTFVFWPLLAYIGAQGFTAAAAIAAIYSMFYVRVQRVEVYAVVCIAFALWVVASSFWAPEFQALLAGNIHANWRAWMWQLVGYHMTVR